MIANDHGKDNPPQPDSGDGSNKASASTPGPRFKNQKHFLADRFRARDMMLVGLVPKDEPSCVGIADICCGCGLWTTYDIPISANRGGTVAWKCGCGQHHESILPGGFYLPVVGSDDGSAVLK